MNFLKIISILLILSFLSCRGNRQEIEFIETKNLTSKQIDSILVDFKFQYQAPIVLDSANQVLIPISTRLQKKKRAYSSDGYYTKNQPRYWNILFYNPTTEETRLLTDQKFRISRIDTGSENDEKRSKVLKEKILYRIGDIDYNKDKKLNHKDPESLFISERNGTNLQRISPIHEDLLYYQVLPYSPQILIQTLRDVNRDSIFNKNDESIWYKAALKNKEWEIREIIDSTQRKKIQNLYFEQWLKKK